MRVKPESLVTAGACVCPGSGITRRHSIPHIRRAILVSAQRRGQIDESSVTTFVFVRVTQADRRGAPGPTATDFCEGESGPAPQGTPLTVETRERILPLSDRPWILNADEPG